MATRHHVRQSIRGGRFEINEVTKPNAKVDALQRKLIQRGIVAANARPCKIYGDPGHTLTKRQLCMSGEGDNK
jgi:hypothetical protein